MRPVAAIQAISDASVLILFDSHEGVYRSRFLTPEGIEESTAHNYATLITSFMNRLIFPIRHPYHFRCHQDCCYFIMSLIVNCEKRGEFHHFEKAPDVIELAYDYINRHRELRSMNS